MKTRNINKYPVLILMSAVLILVSASCMRDFDDLELASLPSTGEVFIDGFSEGLNYEAWGDVTAFDVDEEIRYLGSASMKFAVPDEGATGGYAGGRFVTTVPRDLSGYNALTFWAKASKAAAIGVIGFGNNAFGSKYQSSLTEVRINTNWKKIIIPIADPSKLTSETGMLYYSEEPEDGSGYTFWIDEVKFEKLGTLAHPQAAILEEQDQVIEAENGDILTIGGTYAIFNLPDGTNQRTELAASWFNLSSSDTTVAVITETGLVSVITVGTAVITAELDTLDALGSLTVESIGTLPAPAISAPVPTLPQSEVISLFSNAYTDVPVDTWNPFWEFSTTLLSERQINGTDDVKRYRQLNFVGIEFTSQTIDGSSMTHLHMDIWTPDDVSGAEFGVAVVDFGADNAYGGDNDSQTSFSLNESSLETETWISVDVPLSGLANRQNLAQLVLDGNENFNTVYIDNVYFYIGEETGGSSEPEEAAPTPSLDASDVISIFSDAYTDVPVDNWITEWSSATFEDATVEGNAVKKYSGLDFVGIETTTSTVDASEMTHFHIDVWSANFTSFSIKLVDFGPDGVFEGGDDTEHQLDFTSPTQEEWVSYDILLSDFTDLTTTAHIAQYILVAQPAGAATIFVDNMYFHK